MRMQVSFIKQRIKKDVKKWKNVSHFVEVSTVDAYQVCSVHLLPPDTIQCALVTPPTSPNLLLPDATKPTHVPAATWVSQESLHHLFSNLLDAVVVSEYRAFYRSCEHHALFQTSCGPCGEPAVACSSTLCTLEVHGSIASVCM